MAYTHITSCVQLSQHKTLGEVLLAYGIPAALIAGVIGALVGGGVGAAIALGAVSPFTFITAYCDWWFHYRLICIQDDQCAVGTVGRIAQSTGLDDPDLDYKINLVLAPVARTSKLKAAAQLPLLSPAQQRYFKPQKDAGGNDYPPLNGMDTISTVEEGQSGGTTALHCEIEGDGMKYACTTATVAAIAGAGAGVGGGTVAAGICLASGIFSFVCLVALFASALFTSAVVTGAGWALGVALGVLAGHKGAPKDVLVDLRDGGNIQVGDVIAIVGDWIFDSAHDGWHELHPVKKILKLQCLIGDREPGPVPIAPDHRISEEERDQRCAESMGAGRDGICKLLGEARDPAVRQAQSTPKNQWVAHPRLG